MSLSKYKVSAPGTLYHLYNRGNHKQMIFEVDDDYRLYRGLVRKFCRESNFSIITYCLMPNHIHLLVKQNGDIPPSKLMSKLHTSYAMYYNKQYGKVGHLFQDRYKQKIVSDEHYLLTLVCYIHLNPVKDGLIDIAHRYPWSGCREYRGLNTSRGICDWKEVESLGLNDLPAVAGQTKLARQIHPEDTF